MSYGRPPFDTNPLARDVGKGPDERLLETAGMAGWMARRAMQVHPEIGSNLRGTVRTIVGTGFTDQELGILQDRALDDAEMKDIDVLQGIQAGAPVRLTPAQKARIDRLMRLSGDDELGRRARGAYEKALRDGQIVVR